MTHDHSGADIKALEERRVMRFEARGDMYQRDADGEWVRYLDHANALASAIAERDEARAERDKLEDEKYEPWPEWAKAVLTVIRTRSGYDGYDDVWDGVDLPAELEETFSELEGRAENWKARAEAAAARLEELTRERDEWKNAAFLSDCEAHSGQLDEMTARSESLAQRLEEAKAVLGRITEHRMQDDTVLEAVRGLSIVQEMASAFLHQGGSE